MLTLDEDQRLLMDSAAPQSPRMRRLAERGACASPRAKAFPAPSGRLAPKWAGAACWFPRRIGGTAFGVVGAGLVAREMARDLAPSPFLSTAVLAAPRSPRAARPGSSTAGCRVSRRPRPSSRSPRDGAVRAAPPARLPFDGESISCSTATSPTRFWSRRFEARRRCCLSRRMRGPFAPDPHPRRRVASPASRSTALKRRSGAAPRGRARARTHARRRPRRARARFAASPRSVPPHARYLKSGASSTAGSARSRRCSTAPRSPISRSRTPGRRRCRPAGARRRAPIPPPSTSRSPSRRRAARPRR